MDEKALERIVQAVHALEIREAPKQHPDKTPQCPPLSRFRTLVYRPSTRTHAEQTHMLGCRYCQRTLERCAQEAYHPTPRALLAYLTAGWLPDRESAEEIMYHLEQEQCERCLRLKTWCAAEERLVASHKREQLYLEILAYFVVLGQAAALTAVRWCLQPLLELHQAIQGLTLMVQLLDIVRQKTLPAFLGPADKMSYADDGAAKQLAAQVEASKAAGEAPNVAVLLATGLAYEATGDPLDLEEATDYYRRASQCAPDAYEPYLLLGRTLAQRGRHQEADAALREAARLLARAVQPEPSH